jgi:hypothetical protein
MLRSVPDSAASGTRVEDKLFIACGLAWGSGLIHVVAAIQHVDEYLLFAAFFAVLAPVQFAWGVLVYRDQDRRLLVAGAVASLGIAALWTVSRTIGLPIGETAWKPEAVGALDVVATADELVLAAIVFLHLAAPSRGPLARAFSGLATAAGTFLILASSLALVAGGGHTH